MAHAVLVSLGQTIDQVLSHDLYSISHHKKQQIISIHGYVIFLQTFLEDFPEKANSLEGRIRDVANEAEDIIEYFMWKQIRSRYRWIKWTVGPAKFKFKYQLKKVAEKIDSIAGEVIDIKNSFRIKDVELGDFSAASSSSILAHTGKNDMVGFDDDLIAIKDRLCGESSKRQVIPIFGMGGIGKTTLARNAYDDPLTRHHFYIRAWVAVSQDYNAEQILSSLLVSMKGLNSERCGQKNGSMAENVYRSLKGKRYLIVLDDMWSTKVWDDLNMIFPNDNNGSRIMLTTRLSDVAAYADSSIPLHEMRFMDADQSWNLLRQKVFTHQDCPPKLEEIGKIIARSCRGLPLAIVVIAGLLSTVSKTEASWKEIANNVNSAVATKDGLFEKLLSLSYNHLPHHLRPCFLYMGIFPEDHYIHVSNLIRLWMAEGFMKASVSKSYEEAAEEYLEDLVKRSLVLVTKRKSNGKIKSCSLHDMVRDLCIRKAQEEKFLLHVLGRTARKVFLKNIKNQRRISIVDSDLNSLANIFGSTIRTIICFQRRRGTSLGSLGNFRLLRVLDMVDSYVNSLPAQIFELFHLRYLAFKYPLEIPAAISNLQNLQTLFIHPRRYSEPRVNEPGMVYLSSEIWRMTQLRLLVCYSFGPLPDPEGATFALENLQTLSVANFKCTERILKMIPNLKQLGIFYTKERYGRDNHLYNLVYLPQLENLKVEINPTYLFQPKLPVFPTTLKKLTLRGWKLPWKDMMIIGSLPNLQVLKLKYSLGKDEEANWETSDGGFPQLKFLLIDRTNIRHWITESSHFPSLKFLVLHYCRQLSEIPDGIGEIPTLELIEVKGGNESLMDSAKRIQEEQQSYGNDALLVRCMRFDQNFADSDDSDDELDD